MRSLDDTIVALSSPAGPSPIAIVRLSGPDAFPILETLLAEPALPLSSFPFYSAADAALRLRSGGPSFPATLYLMRAPRSYTRQDVAEVQTVGSMPLLRLLLAALVERGARVAEPGEFTRRAFLAGRLDLAQAEAVLAVIQATTAGELRAAARALQGAASRGIRALHDRLVHLRARVEAAIDLAEHDIPVISYADLLGTLTDALATVYADLRNADAGALPPEGVRVALCGLPNAGKSSLFNDLLGRNRSIVTPVPGTTRDAVAEPFAVGGARFRLYDTAGLAADCRLQIADRRFLKSEIGNLKSEIADHALPDPIDLEAMARSRGLIAGTAIALVVLDASTPLTGAERALWTEVNAPHKCLILSKADLPSAVGEREATELAGGATVLRTSAATREGIGGLTRLLASLVLDGRVEAAASDLTWNARHREALQRAREALGRAEQAVHGGLGMEFVAADLRDAHDALGSITGQVVADDLLDIIFAEFCIGK